MTKTSSAKLTALRNLEELASTHEGKQIARDFGEQCAEMKVYEGVRIARLLEAAFEEGKRVKAAELKAVLGDALKKLS